MSVTKISYRKPIPQIGKTAKDTRMARLIDINSVIDDVNIELTALGTDIATNATNIATNAANIATNAGNIVPRFTFSFRQTGINTPIIETKINTTGKVFAVERLNIGIYRITVPLDTTYFNNGTNFTINGFLSPTDGASGSSNFMVMISELDASEVRIRCYTLIDTAISYLYITTTDNLDNPVEWSAHIASLSRQFSFEYVG